MKPFKSLAILLAAALIAYGSNVTRANDETAAMKELVPTGKLRAGIVYAPALSAFFAVKGADGRPRGVTVDLAEKGDGARAPSVEIRALPAERGHLHFVVLGENGDGAVRNACRRRAAEEPLHVFRQRVGRDDPRQLRPRPGRRDPRGRGDVRVRLHAHGRGPGRAAL